MQRALRSLTTQTLPTSDFEVIVVANACTDDTEAVARSFSDRLSVKVVSEPRLGLHYARHAGARAATAPILVYTDDDVTCSPDWLASLLRAFEDPHVACAGGPIRAVFETAVPSWFTTFPAIYGELDHGSIDRSLTSPADLYGGNFAIRRDVLMTIGGFPPDAFGGEWGGPGETGLLRKLYREKKRICFVAAAKVEHHVPAENTTLDYAIRRMRNHAKAAGVLACNGVISRLGLFYRAFKYSCAAQYFRLKASGSRSDAPAYATLRIWEEYARARARFDRRLARDTSLQPLVTRQDWIHE